MLAVRANDSTIEIGVHRVVRHETFWAQHERYIFHDEMGGLCGQYFCATTCVKKSKLDNRFTNKGIEKFVNSHQLTFRPFSFGLCVAGTIPPARLQHSADLWHSRNYVRWSERKAEYWRMIRPSQVELLTESTKSDGHHQIRINNIYYIIFMYKNSTSPLDLSYDVISRHRDISGPFQFPESSIIYPAVFDLSFS